METRALAGLVMAAWLLGFSACSSAPVYHKDDQVDVARYKSYQWIGQDQVREFHLKDPHLDYAAGDVRVESRPEVQNVMQPIIDADLKKHGLVPALPGQAPDCYVTYFGKAKDRNWVSTWTGFTLGIHDIPVVMFPGYNPEYARNYVDGVIYVVLFDPKTHRPAWVGGVQSNHFGPDFSQPEVATAIDKLFQGFKTS